MNCDSVPDQQKSQIDPVIPEDNEQWTSFAVPINNGATFPEFCRRLRAGRPASRRGGGVVWCGVLGAPSRVICGRGDGGQGGAGERERGRTDGRTDGAADRRTDGGSRRTDTILPRLAAMATSRMAPKKDIAAKKHRLPRAWNGTPAP